MKRILAMALTILSVWSSGGAAQDSQNIVIYKEAGQPPRVDAAGVDLLGAEKIHKLLGEDFVVFHDTAQPAAGFAAMVAVAPEVKPAEPVTPPGTVPPVLPICQCPEDYVAAMRARIQTFDETQFFAPRRVFVTPNQFETLKSGAFPQIDLLRQNNMVTMGDQ